MWRLILTSSLLCCSGPAPVAATAGPVGAACAVDTDCLTGLFCETRIKNGVCTQACDDFVCPEGARCINVVVAVVNESAYRCLQECSAALACRSDGNWQCVHPEGVEYSVCAPA